jgi:serine/threonine protein kinase
MMHTICVLRPYHCVQVAHRDIKLDNLLLKSHASLSVPLLKVSAIRCCPCVVLCGSGLCFFSPHSSRV